MRGCVSVIGKRADKGFDDPVPTNNTLVWMLSTTFIADDTIDESYGVAVVFHEDEDEGERGGESRRGRESMVAHDDEKDMEADDEEGVEADYDEVLKTAVSLVNNSLYM